MPTIDSFCQTYEVTESKGWGGLEAVRHKTEVLHEV